MQKNNNLVVDNKTIHTNVISLFFIENSISNKDQKLINKINSFTYQGLQNLEATEANDEGFFHRYDVDFSDNLEIKAAFIELLKTLQAENAKYKQPIIQIIDFLKLNNNSNLIIKEINGDIGEALVIKKYIELGYAKNIMDALRQKDYEIYDFNLNGLSFEVKTTSIRTKEIKINHDQIPTYADKIFMCIIFVKNIAKTKDNNDVFWTILDLYEYIEKFIPLSPILQTKKQHYEALDNKIIFNNAFDINEVEFRKINIESLINIKINPLPSGIKDLIYVIDASNTQLIHDVEFIKLINN